MSGEPPSRCPIRHIAILTVYLLQLTSLSAGRENAELQCCYVAGLAGKLCQRVAGFDPTIKLSCCVVVQVPIEAFLLTLGGRNFRKRGPRQQQQQ